MFGIYHRMRFFDKRSVALQSAVQFGMLAVQTRDFAKKVCTFHNYSLSLQTKI